MLKKFLLSTSSRECMYTICELTGYHIYSCSNNSVSVMNLIFIKLCLPVSVSYTLTPVKGWMLPTLPAH